MESNHDAQVMESKLMEFVSCSKLLNLDELCIAENRAVWHLVCDLYCLDDDGNLFDAFLLSLVEALKTVVFPKVLLTKENEVRMVTKESNSRLKLYCSNIKPLSFGTFENLNILDPTSYEEKIMHGGLCTIVCMNENDVFIIKLDAGSEFQVGSLSQFMERCKNRPIEFQ